ncbi:guanylate kinase [Candidatus Poribacteria bacterium]|nr:MAG: guanylate kinase [Candidatus Poribacteria bacterium]
MWNNRPSQQGLFIVISGPSGTGKTSVIRELCESDTTLAFSISATTRPPRSDEADGIDYYFLDETEFEALINSGGFLEWVKYGGHYYGTLKSTIESTIEKGKDLVLEIDVHGAMKVKDLGIRYTSIFLLPPSLESLEKRLRNRKTESDSELEQRLLTAKSEFAYVKDYKYCILNPDHNVKEAVTQIRHIISAERCRIDDQLLDAISQEFCC